ncbi:MAG: porin [Sulfuricellaceae bacterium]|nr:porin [Sulfuricellaceae bacterium]
MNKKLLALAIAAALAPAAALADGGNVKITGSMHVSLDSLDTGTTSNTNVSSNSSWIKFSGDESLGNGLKAIWQVDTTVALDDVSSTAFADRNSFAGLSGGFGTVIMGKHDTPMKLTGRSVDLFGDQIGDSRNIIMGTNTTNMFDLRPQNVVAYVSPDFSGFSGIAAYVTNLDNNAATDASITAYSLSAKYASGPLMLGAAYESHDLVTTDRDSYRLVAGYTFGDFKVVGLYQSQRDIVAVGTNLEDQDVWGLGGAYKMGAYTIKAQYYQADDVDNKSDTGTNMFALGVDYALSKRTTAYVAYAQTDNDAAATYSAFGGGHLDNPGVVVGDTGRGYSLGMIHKF